MTPPITEIAEKATVRLVPTAYYKPPVLQPLIDTDEELELLARFEGQTNQRLTAQTEGLDDLNPRELAFRARADQLRQWGHTYINAAFAHPRETGNRFNDGRRGAWYCAFDEMTAVQEVAFHRTRELGFIGVFEDEAVYIALLADFIGAFPDLRAVEPVPNSLHPDPAIGYPAGQALALALRDEGHGGLIYPSVRRPGGTCFAAFVPQIIQNVRPAAKWRMVWNGSPDFTLSVDG